MAKTYTAVTVANATAGNAILASDHSTNFQNVNNLIVPAMVRVKRTSNLTGYTSATAITWQAEDFDTDDMWSSGSSLTVNTAGVYAVTFAGRMTTATAPTFVEANFGGSLQDRNAVALSRANDYRFTVTTVAQLGVSSTISASLEFSGGTTHAIDGTTVVTTLTAVWVGRAS